MQFRSLFQMNVMLTERNSAQMCGAGYIYIYTFCSHDIYSWVWTSVKKVKPDELSTTYEHKFISHTKYTSSHQRPLYIHPSIITKYSENLEQCLTDWTLLRALLAGLTNHSWLSAHQQQWDNQADTVKMSLPVGSLQCSLKQAPSFWCAFRSQHIDGNQAGGVCWGFPGGWEVWVYHSRHAVQTASTGDNSFIFLIAPFGFLTNLQCNPPS